MNIINRLRRQSSLKARIPDDVLGFALHANGRVEAVKQGSGMYGAGFGSNAFSETAFGTVIALSQSTFGWSAAYSVSTWVYRCIEVRKNAVSRMPRYVVDRRTGKNLPNHPLAVALRRNKQNLFKKIEQSQLLYGETFIEKASNEYGFKSDLYWLNNNGMAVLIGAGRIIGYSYTAMQGGDPQNFEPEEVAFMKTDNPFNDLRGMSPTEVIMDEVAIDKDVARVVRAYYANDTRVGIIFIPKVNLQPADQERFMAFFKRDNQGPNNAGKPVIMPQDMTVERIQEPATLDDVQLRESTRRDIAAAYGVPLSLAGAWDDANYQTLPGQRQSFYEETVIPECENIAEFINEQLMPVFDASGNALFKFDYDEILALSEDTQRRNDAINADLAAGKITRAEARLASKYPTRPVDDVYYIPAGATIVPADEETLVTPQANEVVDNPIEQQQVSQQDTVPKPQVEAPAEPKAIAAPPQTKSISVPQATPLEELAAWEKKALNSNALKAANFVAYVVPFPVQTALKDELRQAGKDASKPTIRAIFSEARKALTPQPPARVLDYWRDYDALMEELGHDWLSEYMRRAWAMLANNITPDMTPADVQHALDSHHDEFTAAWLGTPEKPGPLQRLIMAGMGAAQTAIYDGTAANPQRPVQAKALAVDWNLLSKEARDHAKQYFYDLIRDIDDTTREEVQKAIAKWIESGEPLDALQKSLEKIFNDPARARLIAQTETSRAYASGSVERYRRADVKTVRFMTVNDSHVCPECGKYKGQTMPIDSGIVVPLHPGCRCYWRPVLSEDD